MTKPICQDCVSEVQLFKWCQNLSAGTVLQRCSCLSGVETYLPALCCEVQLFQWCSNLSAGHCAAGVQLFKQCAKPICLHCAAGVVSKPTCWRCAAGVMLFKLCGNLSAGTVFQRCSHLSGVETYLPALCCRGAAV